MGGGSSKKEEPKKQRLEDQIPVYQRPPSPKVEQVQIKKPAIKQDDNIDREAENKKLADAQRKKKASPSPDKNKNRDLEISVSLQQDKDKEKKENKPKPLKLIQESFDNQMEAIDAEELKKLERILQDEDLSPINKSVTECKNLYQRRAQKQQKNAEKIQNALQKVEKAKQLIKRQFDWPEKGQVKLTSVGFEYNFNYKVQKLAMQKSYENCVNSILKWVRNDENQTYEFKLSDKDIYDQKSGNVKNLTYNEVEFMVDLNGIGLKHESDFVRNLQKARKLQELEEEEEQKDREELLAHELNNIERLTQQKMKQKKKPPKKKENAEQIIKKTEKQLEQFWNFTFQCWYTQDEQQAQQLRYQDKDCLGMNMNKFEPKLKLQDFLLKKLQDSKFFKQCFESNKTIRDTLKKWQLFSEEEVLEYLNVPQYSVVQIQKKISFPLISKYAISDGVIEYETFRPLAVNWETCRKTVMEHNKDLFVDIEHEKRLVVFVWDNQKDNRSKLQSENTFVEELNKFRDNCDMALKETLFQLSVIPNFPMANRPKYKQKYFQLQ